MKKNILFFVLALLLLGLSSCNVADGIGDEAGNAVYMSNINEAGVFSVLASDEAGATFSITPRIAKIASEPVFITLAVDEETLKLYNEKNKLSLKSIEPSDVIFKDADGKESVGQIKVAINKGAVVAAVEGQIKSLDPKKYSYDGKFAVPIKIVSVEGSLKLLSAPNTTIVTLNRKIKTSVMHMIDPRGGGYTLHFIPNKQYAEEMTEWTLQFMALFNQVTGDNQTSASLGGANGFYNRISTTGIQIKSEGRDGPDTWTGTFTNNKGVVPGEWINIAYVYRRSGLVGKLSVYFDGALQHTFTTSLLFLSPKDALWGFGNENVRDYYLREFRYWSRALTDAEILDKQYLPEDPKAPGLEAYFPLTRETFDEEKKVFRDLTGKWHFVCRNDANIEVVDDVVFPSVKLTIEKEEKPSE